MSFMKPQIVDASEIADRLPTDVGWFACRLSAPGYQDCTDWTLCDTIEDCCVYLEDTYGDGFDDEDNEIIRGYEMYGDGFDD